jgi:hypothetical protein
LREQKAACYYPGIVQRHVPLGGLPRARVTNYQHEAWLVPRLTLADIKLAEGCGLTTDRQNMTPSPVRIDLWRGVKAVLLTLVIPMSIAIIADVTMGTLPWLTIVAVVICIPLASVVVNRTLLAEFDRVVALVAPEEEPEATVLPAESAEPNSISNDWSLDGQSPTEGAHKHHE